MTIGCGACVSNTKSYGIAVYRHNITGFNRGFTLQKGTVFLRFISDFYRNDCLAVSSGNGNGATVGLINSPIVAVCVIFTGIGVVLRCSSGNGNVFVCNDGQIRCFIYPTIFRCIVRDGNSNFVFHGLRKIGVYFGIGNLGLGRSNFGLRRSNLGLRRSNLGLGRSNFRLGRSNLGLGRSNFGLGRSNLGLGRSNLGLGRSNFGLGRSNLGLGRSNFGLGNLGFSNLGFSNLGLGNFGVCTGNGYRLGRGLRCGIVRYNRCFFGGCLIPKITCNFVAGGWAIQVRRFVQNTLARCHVHQDHNRQGKHNKNFEQSFHFSPSRK